ncbi:hypothetical protein Tco_0315623 [Tanacetum coccineum]
MGIKIRTILFRPGGTTYFNKSEYIDVVRMLPRKVGVCILPIGAGPQTPLDLGRCDAYGWIIILDWVLVFMSDGVKNAASSGSEHGFVSHGSDLNFGRSNKKRVFSSSRRSGSRLPPVAEEFPWDHPDPNYKLTKLNKNNLLENGALPFAFPLKFSLKMAIS